MPLSIGWTDIAIRLGLTVLVGFLFGLNRQERSRPAGLRTTILVCLAASASMIQVNLLLPLAGKSLDSFIVMDLMRLPLGILSGMGFIGAGAILRRDGLIHGVTTAATLWFVTVVGLCLGGGQLQLGCAVALIGLFVLVALGSIESLLPKTCCATLIVKTRLDKDRNNSEEELRRRLESSGLAVISTTLSQDRETGRVCFSWELQWRGQAKASIRPPPAVAGMVADRDVLSVEWKPAAD
jgi:putative Mg2+ transporter-C (MgtC) family protein